MLWTLEPGAPGAVPACCPAVDSSHLTSTTLFCLRKLVTPEGSESAWMHTYCLHELGQACESVWW